MHKPLRWRALADLRGGHSQALELLARFLTQFSLRTRNNFIAIFAALVLVLALAALPAQAQTTATISAPSTLPEGGLVAQQVGNCPEMQRERPTKMSSETVAEFYTRYIAWYQANDYNRNYCEFRDIPDNAARAQTVTVTVRNAQTGLYKIARETSLNFKIGNDVSFGHFTALYNLTAGETKTITFSVVSIPNYTPGDTATNAIVVLPPGATSFADAIARHEITIVDDDNTAYVGRRRHHPYGETWNSQPHCYSHGCAWD